MSECDFSSKIDAEKLVIIYSICSTYIKTSVGGGMMFSLRLLAARFDSQDCLVAN